MMKIQLKKSNDIKLINVNKHTLIKFIHRLLIIIHPYNKIQIILIPDISIEISY
jgi:hypothetical protein